MQSSINSNNSLYSLLVLSSQKYPDKIAVSDKYESLTYNKLKERVQCLSNFLKDSGVKNSDHISIFLDHGVEQVVSILAVSALGGVFVPINKNLLADQVKFIITNSESKILITSTEFKKNLGDLKNAKEFEKIILIDQVDQTSLGGAFEINERNLNPNGGDLASLLYTSGSTGFPKGVMVSHENLLAGAKIVTNYLNLSSQDRLLVILPLSFDYGLNQLITMLLVGGTCHLENFIFPDDIVNAIEKNEITGLAGMPFIWVFLVKALIKNQKLNTLRYITNSGQSLSLKLLKQLKDILPSQTKFFLMYGLTEAFRSTFLPAEDLDRKPDSIGKAIPQTEIFVLKEDGTFCEPGEIGELVHRGPTVAMGYWKNLKATREKFRPYPLGTHEKNCREKVVFSGDLVNFDKEGYFYFHGRKDFMIKSQGFRISPNEIEEVFYRSNLVKEVAAFGVKDDVWGEKIHVQIVSDSNVDRHLLEIEIGEFCKNNFPRYMIPKIIEIVSKIVKTPNNKPDYALLKKLKS